LECCTFSVGLGFACFVGTGFALGTLGWLTREWIGLSLIILAPIGLPALGQVNRICQVSDQDSQTHTRLVEYVAFTFLFVLLLVNLIGALVPDTVWDANSHHLAVSKQWLSVGQLSYIPYNPFANGPLNLSVIYALEMALIDGSILPQLTHFSLGILNTLLIYGFVRSRYSNLSACLACVIFYSIPAVTWLSGTAISDLGISFFTLFGIVAFLHWVERDDPSWLKMAALGTGLAMGTKITGVFALPLLVFSIFYVGISNREAFLQIVPRGFLVSLIALGLAAPWYLKSYIQTGNPVFPFLYNLFGGKYWTEAVNARFLAAQFGFMGIGRSITDYLFLPLRLLIPNNMPYEGPISWIFLVGFLWGITQRKDKTATYLSVYAALYFGGWSLFTTQGVRMLLPALGALSIVAATGAVAVTGQMKSGKSILTLLMVALIIEGLLGVWRERSGVLRDQVAVVLGEWSREEYLHKYFYLDDVFSFANTKLPAGGAILGFNEVRGYLSQHEFIWGDPSLQAYVDYDRLKTKESLKRRLDELSVEYVLINNTEYPTSAQQLNPIKEDLQLIYKQGEVYLYRLVPGDSVR
jgi:hypothetical protein